MLGSFGGIGTQGQVFQHGNPGTSVERNLQHMGYSIAPDERENDSESESVAEPSQGKICSQCGEHNDDLYRFCGNCSAKL